MTENRRPPTLKQKLAALIVAHYNIPYEVSKTMSVERILSLVEYDHYPICFALARDLGWHPDQYNAPSNLRPLLPQEHAIKSAKIDVPQLAKGKRISAAHIEFRRRILAKDGADVRSGGPNPTDGEQSGEGARSPRRASFPKGRKLQGRSFQTNARSGGKTWSRGSSDA